MELRRRGVRDVRDERGFGKKEEKLDRAGRPRGSRLEHGFDQFGAVYLETKCYHRQLVTAGKKEEREK